MIIRDDCQQLENNQGAELSPFMRERLMSECVDLSGMTSIEMDLAFRARGLRASQIAVSSPHGWIDGRPETSFQRFVRLSKIAAEKFKANKAQTLTSRTFGGRSRPVCPVSTYTPQITPSQARLSTTLNLSFCLPKKAWGKATAADKFARSIHTVEGLAGMAMTLNLSPSRERALLKSADPARALSGHINRALKSAGIEQLAYSFVLEISPAGRIHLHGALAPGFTDLTALKRALMSAGGKLSGHAASRQLKLKPIEGASGWHGYLAKDMGCTKRTLSIDKITFISAL